MVIYADDLGYGDVSCYGAKNIKTPHIDRLAKTGIKCTCHKRNLYALPFLYSDRSICVKKGQEQLPEMLLY